MARSCGLVIEGRVSPRRYQRKPVHTDTQEKEKMFLSASITKGWCTVAFVIHIAGYFSSAYFIPIEHQTVKMKNTFTRESDS